MADSSVTYAGNGSTQSFSVPFPYIDRSYVKVYVNSIQRLTPLDYVWTDSSTIQFKTAPLDGDGIVFRRVTPGDSRLVDFQNGAVLTEAELDLAFNQVFHLSQESKENYAELVNNELIRIAGALGIVETDPDAILAAMVQSALNNDLTAELQARISDIDTNAASILSLAVTTQTQLNQLLNATVADIYVQDDEPVPGEDGIPDPIGDGSRWYDSDDNNHPYIWNQAGEVWQDLEDPRIGINAADITALDVRLTDAESGISGNAEALSVLDTTVSGQGEDIVANAAALTSLGAAIDQNADDIDDVAAAVVTEAAARAAADAAEAALRVSLAAVVSGNGTNIATNAAAIVTEAAARASGDSAIASSVTALTSTVGGHTATLGTYGASIDGLLVKYGVSLNSNGHITGFAQHNDGVTGSFTIVADQFAIVDPGDDENSFTPFLYSEGVVSMNSDVRISGDLIVGGTINGTKIGSGEIDEDHIVVPNLSAIDADLGSITAGNITLDSSGFIKGGQTAFNTGAGFFLGYHTDAYKFSIGNGSDNFLTWDGSELVVRGNISIGSYTASDSLIVAANTERTTGGGSPGAYTLLKQFTVNKPGTLRVKCEVRMSSVVGGVHTAGAYRIVTNAGTQASGFATASSYAAKAHDITLSESDTYVRIECASGERNTSDPITVSTLIRNASINADIGLGEAVAVD